MKLSRLIVWLILIVAVIVGLNYTVVSLRRAAAPPAPAKTPSLDDASVRMYGRVEPLHREVFLGPLQPQRVTRILVNEGAAVNRGQVLVELDADVEQQAAEVARFRAAELEAQLDLLLDELNAKRRWPSAAKARLPRASVPAWVRELESRLDLILDELKRKEPPSDIGAVSEQDYSQKILEAKPDLQTRSPLRQRQRSWISNRNDCKPKASADRSPPPRPKWS